MTREQFAHYIYAFPHYLLRSYDDARTGLVI